MTNDIRVCAGQHDWGDMQGQERWPLTGDDGALEDRLTGVTYYLTRDADGLRAIYEDPMMKKDYRDLAFCLAVMDELRVRLVEAEAENQRLDDRIELARNVLWDETADDNTRILTASAFLDGALDDD